MSLILVFTHHLKNFYHELMNILENIKPNIITLEQKPGKLEKIAIYTIRFMISHPELFDHRDIYAGYVLTCAMDYKKKYPETEVIPIDKRNKIQIRLLKLLRYIEKFAKYPLAYKIILPFYYNLQEIYFLFDYFRERVMIKCLKKLIKNGKTIIHIGGVLHDENLSKGLKDFNPKKIYLLKTNIKKKK